MSDQQHLFLQFFCTSKVLTNLQFWYSLDESPPPSLPPCPSWCPTCAVYHNFRLQLSHILGFYQSLKMKNILVLGGHS